MEERVYKRREDVFEIGGIIRLILVEMKVLFFVLLEEYGVVYISGVVWVNGRVFCKVLLNVVIKYGVVVYYEEVLILIEDGVVIGVKMEECMFYVD